MLFTCISGHSGELVNARGNIDQFRAIAVVQPSRSARNQGHDKQGEIWMSNLLWKYSSRNGLVMTLKEGSRFLCLAALLCEQSC